ncbi:uncharacterized protein [Euwallacea similis]|uniref:uncharacterized protein n=1 Tax=Euwallacea similis TaxID=1736056 RepID=UPI00344E1FD0
MKVENLLEQWKNYQLSKLQQKQLKMPYPCKLALSDGITIENAILSFITNEGQRRIVISRIDGNLPFTLLFDEISGFTPNQGRGTIELSHGEERAILTFASEINYLTVLKQLRIFLREIANIPTSESSSDDDHNTSSSSNE